MTLLRERDDKAREQDHIVGQLLLANDEEGVFSNLSSSLSTTASSTSISIVLNVYASDQLLIAAGNPLFLGVVESYLRTAPEAFAILEAPVAARARKKTIRGPYKAAMVRKILKLAAGPMTPMPSDREGFFAALKKA